MANGVSNQVPPLRLTQTVQKGGCAAKVSATELRKILAGVRFPSPDSCLMPGSLLVDGRLFDDASVVRLTSETAIVSTLDFFTPIVDSPRAFGAIAAANALSDIYAMGGRPLTALGILAFPVATFESTVIQDVMQGACDTLALARATLSGGHSIDDDTLKFGLAVTGLVHPEKIWSNAGAKPDDVLILTKAIGTGTLTAALKRDALNEDDIREAMDSMMLLNNVLDPLQDAGLADAVHAATDITGFGFAGHAMHIAQASAVDLEIDFSKIPLLARALEMIGTGYLTKAHRTNREYTAAALNADTSLSDFQRLLLFDPQTSGGLLLSVAADQADACLEAISGTFPRAAKVGRVTARLDAAASRIRVKL